MPQDNLAELTEVALQLKEAFEDRDIKTLQSLLQRAQLNILGRFIAVQEFIAKLQELFTKIEQPALDIVRIVETDVGPERGLISYIVDVSWVDRHAWEERLFPGLLTLQVAIEQGRGPALSSGVASLKNPEPRGPRKPEPTDIGGSGDEERRRWIVTGVTFARAPEKPADAGEPEPPSTGEPPAPRPFDLFGFWY